MGRFLAYAYALVFAALINPFQSWLGLLSGYWWGVWDRLFNDLATGVLFGYGALISIEILIRTQMFSSPITKARPTAVPLLRLFAILTGFGGLAAATLMWATQRTHDATASSAYWSGVGFCVFVLAMLLYAVELESVGKKEIEAFLESASE